MQLTKIERVLLANQYRILERLDPENGEIYAVNYRVLESGFELNYALLDQIFKDGVSKEQCKEVLQILTMFETLYQGYLKATTAPDIKIEAISFSGFDEKEEAEHFAYAHFLVHDEGRFSVLKADKLNSQVPMLGVYRRMLWEWEKCADKHNLQHDDTVRIQAAQCGAESIPDAVWRAFVPRSFPPPVSFTSSGIDVADGRTKRDGAATRKGD